VADFDPNAYAADEPAPPTTAAPPAFDPNAYAADEPEIPNLGVLPMPSRAAHRAALEAPPIDQDTAPGSYTLGGPRLSAFQAASSGVNGDQAAQTLKLAKLTGIAPETVARNVDSLQRMADQREFAARAEQAPSLADYAGQSPIHAALVKDDVGPLEALEQGLLDVGYQVAASKEMTFPSTETEQNLLSAEMETSRYEKRPSNLITRGIRDIPTLATFYLAGAGGKLIGGTPGELTAQAGAMFLLNRGTLYRQIMQQMPYPETDEQGIIGQGAYDPVEYEARARAYATVGAGAGAVLSVGISHAVGMALPGVVTRANVLSNRIIARAFTDPATREIVANLIGKVVEKEGVKTVTGAAGWGGHTLAGALAMAVPAVVDDATVQKALKGEIDPGKAAVAGWEAFKNALVAAGTLSALPHVVPTVRAAGRAALAPFDAARLDHNVEQIQAAKLTTRHPEEAEKLVGRMTDKSDADTVFVSPEAMADPKLAAKVADAAGPHAMGDAQVTGGDVAIPAEKYLVRLSGDHAALRENVKTLEDGATSREAAEIPTPDTLTSLLAQRSWILQTEVDTPERLAKVSALEDRMRGVASRGPGRAGGGRIATEEEMKQAAADYAQMKPPGQEAPPAGEPAAAPPPPDYEVPPEPKVTVDDEAMAREHIEGKTIGEIRPSYYETQARRAGERIVKLATGPDPEHERILTKYAEAMDVSLDSLRNAVQGTFGADTLPAARRKLRTAETEANRLEAGRLETLKKLEGEHAMNVANRQADIQQAVTHQKNGKLFAEVARNIRNELDRTEARLLKKAGDAEFLATLAKAGPEYRDAHDAIFAALFTGPEPIPQRGAIDPLVARLERDALPVSFDVDHIHALLADPVQWKDLTPAEARNVADAVDNIRAAAREVNAIELADRRASIQDRTAELQKHFTDLKRLPEDFQPLPPPSDAGKGTIERAGEKMGRIRGEFHQPREILRRMGSVGREAWDDYLKARNYEAKLQGTVGDRWIEATQNFPKEVAGKRLDGVKGVGSPVVADNLWVRQDLWTLAGWYGSESGAQRLRAGLRVTDDQILTALSQLTKPEATFIDSLHSLSDETIWPLLRDHEVKKSGASAPKIEARPFTVTLSDGETHTFRGGYWPGKDAEPKPRGKEGDVSSYWGGLRDGFPSTAKSFTEKRVERATYRPDLNWSNYTSHVSAVLRYLAFDDWVRNFGRLLRDDQFRKVAENGLGTPGAQDVRELDKFVQIAARGRMEAPKMGATEVGRLIGGGLRSRVATAAFQMKLPIVLGQLSHLAATPFATEIGPLDMVQGSANALRPEKWNEYHAESQQLPYRWDGYGSKMREMMADLGPQQRGEARKTLDAVGHAGYHMMDGYLSASIYGAGKIEAESRGLTGAEAVKFADDKVATMMPPINLAEQSSIARDRGLIGSLLLVRNFPNQLYNIGAQMSWNGRNRILAMDPGWQRMLKWLGVTATGAASFVGMMWGVHILGRFIMGHGRQEDESTPQWVARGALAAPFYETPLVSDLAEIGAHWAVSHKTLAQIAMHGNADIQSAPMLAEFQTIIRTLGEASDPGKGSERRVFAGLKLAANIFNIGDYPLKPIQYGYDLSTGKARPRGPFDIAGGFLYGQRPHQSRNPFTAAQDVASGRFR
jgi:hypothetical protein